MTKDNIEDIEVALIGLLVNHNQYTSQILASVIPDNFKKDLHQFIFKTIVKMYEQGKQINGLTVSRQIAIDYDAPTKKACAIVLANSMAALRFNEPVEEYIAIIKESFIGRELPVIISEELMNSEKNLDGFRTANSIIDRLTKLVESNSTEDKLLTTMELMDDERKLYYTQELLAAEGKLIGVNTGLNALNDYTGGWQNELIVIAGRPSMGKTALAIFHGLSTDDYGIYINCEMSKSQLAQRLILNQSDGTIDGGRLKKRLLRDDEKLIMEQSIGAIEKKKIQVYDKPSCGVHEAIRVIKKAYKKNRCRWAIIDYLQLLQLEGGAKGNREQEVSTMIKVLKRCQLELGIPIILLSQLSREVEKRSTKMPILADLRESGEIEQTADTVIFIWRPAYYKLSNEAGVEYTNEIFYLFEKHRQGAVGLVKFRHNDTMSNFYDDEVIPVLSQPARVAPVKSWFETDGKDDFLI
jgi:replicative DNA helicase